MTSDFNIRNSNWDSSYLYHSTYADILSEVADALNLEWSSHINPVSTRYVDNLKTIIILLLISVTNFIQLVSPQLVDQFSQTKFH